MANEQLPDMLTKVSTTDFLTALSGAWQELFSETPKRESILVLAAQSALETARWRSCHAWNFGNAKHVANDGRDFTYFRCSEILNGKEVWFDPPSPYCCFRAFRTIHEGAADYLAMMKRNFASAWPAVLAGDPRAFVQKLKAAHYFTAAEGPYENSVAAIFHEFGGLPWQPSPSEPLIDDDTRARVLALVAITLRQEMADGDRETDPAPAPDFVDEPPTMPQTPASKSSRPPSA